MTTPRVQLASQADLDAWVAAAEVQKTAKFADVETRVQLAENRVAMAVQGAQSVSLVKTVDLITQMRTPQAVGYQAYLRPANSQEAIDYFAEMGIPLILPVMWHSNGNMFMGTSISLAAMGWMNLDGSTSTVTDAKTLAFDQLVSTIRIPPAAFGGKAGRIATLNWLLNKWGGRVPIILNPQGFSAGTQSRIDVFSAVTTRNLHKAVAMISASKSFAIDVHAAGIYNILQRDDSAAGAGTGNDTGGVGASSYWAPGQPGENDPIIAVANTTTDAQVTELRTAFPAKKVFLWSNSGLRTTLSYTQQVARGVQLVAHDEPVACNFGRGQRRWNSDEFSSRELWAGFRAPARGTFRGPNWYGRLSAADAYSSAASSGDVPFIFLGKRGPYFQFEFDLQFGDYNSGGDQTRWAAINFGQTNDDEYYVDATSNPRDVMNGYHFLIRRTGKLELYKLTDSVASALLAGSAVPAVAVAPTGGVWGAICRYRIEVITDRIRFTNLTGTGAGSYFVEALDTAYRPTAFLGLDNSGSNAYIRNLDVLDLAS